ncbi:MAG: lipoyl(octanoyl) transferase LipB [bacterium]
MHPVIIRELGLSQYETVFHNMQAFTATRDESTLDEIWLTEHQPVFTQGQAGKAEHLLAPGNIPVVQSDRGGQVTYHGPGQITAYLMFDLRRMGLGVRNLVTGIETVMVDTLAAYDIEAAPRADAPGVYIGDNKIGSLGLRVRRGCSYHGLSLNVDMDLEPFSRINPCGLFGIQVTHMASFREIKLPDVQAQLTGFLLEQFNLTQSRQDSSGAC